MLCVDMCVRETEEQAERTALKQMLHPSVTDTQWLSLVRKKESPLYFTYCRQRRVKTMAYNGIKSH